MFKRILLAYALAMTPVAAFAQQGFPQGNIIGPGGTFGPTIQNFLYPYSTTGVTIANLPTCNASLLGVHAWVTNGLSAPPAGASVSATGGTYDPVVCVSQSAAGTYTWAYDNPVPPAVQGGFACATTGCSGAGPSAVTVTALSGCSTGGSPTIVGNQFAGLVTAGTTASTTCTITWPTTRGAAPNCEITGHTAAAGLPSITVENTTTLTWTFTSTASTVWDYICYGV